MTTAWSSSEAAMIRLITQGVAQAQREDRTIDKVTARRIAACVHRGLGGELERFAATGVLRNPHAARLELFYSTVDEPQFHGWRAALRRFITEDARHGRTVTRPAPTRTSDTSAASPSGPLPVANPRADDCPSCDPSGALVYVRAETGDRIGRAGVALHMQHHACREFVRHRLRKHLEATFADQSKTKNHGFERLLGHVAACHNRRVVVHRLDRLGWGEANIEKLTRLGARVLSVTEPNTRGRASQAETASRIRWDIDHFFPEPVDKRKEMK